MNVMKLQSKPQRHCVTQPTTFVGWIFFFFVIYMGLDKKGLFHPYRDGNFAVDLIGDIVNFFVKLFF